MPQAVRKVEIPKPDGKGTRMLGIPTVMDRMIQR
jgi:RNA-directed DNA polymerase